MTLFDLVLNNLRRRKGRMILLLLGLAVGVATVVAMVAITDALQADITGKLDEYGANILIVPQSNALALSYGGVSVASATYDVGELSLSDLDSIKTIKNAKQISIVSPKLLGAVPMGGRLAMIAGVRFPDELKLKRWWRLDGKVDELGEDQTALQDWKMPELLFLELEPDEALAGKRLADELKLSRGSTIEIAGQPFRVHGILAENGSQDDDILFIDLSAAQRVLNKPNSISLIEVAALCTECPVEDMVKQIGEVLPQAKVTALRQSVTLRMETVEQLGRFALALSMVVMVIGALVVLTTMLGSVAERRQEIGLFRALGFRQMHVMQVILSEAALVSLAGGALGWLAGMGAAMVLAPRAANLAASVSWNPWLAVGAIGAALLVGLAASLYPAKRAAQLDPTTAMRSL